MKDSVDFYNAAFNDQQSNLQNPHPYFQERVKNSYLQIVTTIFYELIMKKTSPLLSEMCSMNGINFKGLNFQIEKISVSGLPNIENSYDMYCILAGLNTAFSENLDTCASFYEQYKDAIFNGQILRPEDFYVLSESLQALDKKLGQFLTQEKIVEKPVEKIVEVEVAPLFDKEEKILLKELNAIAQNRIGDDEKIVDAIKSVQSSMQDEVATIQDSLKKILEIRDGLDFRTLKEPIYQLIQLYKKLNDNLKRHPQEDSSKGYAALIKRCQSFLNYIAQSLKMLGVEIINNAGEKFDPDKNQVADDLKISFDSTVIKINKVGFIYKGQVLEKAEVEVAENGGKLNENWN